MSISGYEEFEFDLPSALLARLVDRFEGMAEQQLSSANVIAVPDVQGVYELLVREKETAQLVYIGKTDSKHGLRDRLLRHSEKVLHRDNLDPAKVYFKAIRVFVFTAMDLEEQLIEHYGGVKKVEWNGSGFGSNDVGVERDTTNYKPDHFETKYPINVATPLAFAFASSGWASDVLRVLKRKLPYTIRFQNDGRAKSRTPHPDLTGTPVILDPKKHNTAETALRAIVSQLPKGWHVTKLPSHIIMYKNDRRKFPSGKLIGKSPVTR